MLTNFFDRRISRLCIFLFFFFNDTATTEIYTLSLHDALPISRRAASRSHTLSPTTTDSSIGTPSRSAAARNRSGSGFACSTWSRVTIGTPAGMPSRARLGLGLSLRPLGPIAHGAPAFLRQANSSRAPRGGLHRDTL